MRNSLVYDKVRVVARFSVADNTGSPGLHERGDSPAAFIPDVNDSNAIRLEAFLEESHFGPEVFLHGGVVIEMVLREVGETRGIERHAGQALLVEGVAGSLHGQMRDAM